MGTTLTGTTPQDTYDSLIKVTDNGPISGTAKYLSDGLGNDSTLALSTTAVGVGTNTPSNFLQVTDPNSSVSGAQLTLEGRATGYGAGVVFSSRVDNASGALVPMAKITGDGEDSWTSTAATQDAGMRFSTATNGSLTEKMRINTAGNVGIGTSAPTQKLHVYEASVASQAYLLVENNRARNAAVYTKTTAGGFYAGTSIGTDTLCYQIYDDSAGERLRVTSDGYLRMASGSLGIQFNGDTAAANALDDYEEGTWTPVLRGSSTEGTYEQATFFALYTKIGRQVTLNAQINLASSITGGGTGYLQITGLPFAKSTNQEALGSCWFSGVDFTGSFVVPRFVSTAGAGSVIYFIESVDNGSVLDLPISGIAANDIINFSLTYFV